MGRLPPQHHCRGSSAAARPQDLMHASWRQRNTYGSSRLGALSNPDQLGHAQQLPQVFLKTPRAKRTICECWGKRNLILKSNNHVAARPSKKQRVLPGLEPHWALAAPWDVAIALMLQAQTNAKPNDHAPPRGGNRPAGQPAQAGDPGTDSAQRSAEPGRSPRTPAGVAPHLG